MGQKTLVVLLVVPLTLLVASGTGVSTPFAIELESEHIGDPIPVGEQDHAEVFVTLTTNAPLLCIHDTTVTIDLIVEGDAPEYGFLGDINPTTATFTIPAGIYSLPAGPDYIGGDAATFTAMITKDPPEGHNSHGFVIEAIYDGEPVSGCIALEWRDAEDSTYITVTAEPSQPEQAETQDQERDEERDPHQVLMEAIPGAPIVVVLTLITAAVTTARRQATTGSSLS